MLTSPVNVALALNGAPLKPHAAPSDSHARKEPSPLASPVPVVETVIEPALPSNSPITSVNAVAATAGNRTILQELSLNIAVMLKIARRQDESLTSLFMRIVATIEAMPQAERLQFEVRSGLKGLKITLADLAAALRKPDGPEAARLTAMAEAPSAVPGRTAVSAATNTYLQEGTADGQAEETLAMRAAARSSAAGQNVFTAESRIRHAELQPTDAKVLQDQLKTMFEAGDTEAAAGDEVAAQDSAEMLPPDRDPESPVEATASEEVATSHHPASNGVSEKVAISSSNLRLDPQALARIRTAAQAIADGLPETAHGNKEQPAEKADAGDRRVQTLLTLKGIVEAVTALPAKAVEILATAPAETEMLTAEKTLAEAEAKGAGVPVLDEDELPELAAAPEEQASEQPDAPELAAESPGETQPDDASALPARTDLQANAEKARHPAEPEWTAPPRPDLLQHGVPFAYAPVPPAREEMEDTVVEEDARREGDDGAEEDGEDDREKRRPRDEYDAIHDPLPEEEAVLVINRDSSESDRAFALYQRMGGF